MFSANGGSGAVETQWWLHWSSPELGSLSAPRHGDTRFLAQNIVADTVILTQCKMQLVRR
jgi:hypothetical protein